MPTRELLLAQALDTCIRAERRRPGAAREIIAHQPSWARVDLQRLLGLAGSLDAVATNAVMSEEFRVQTRARLMRRIGASASANGVLVALGHLSTMPSTNGRHHAAPPSRPRWLWRGGAALAAAAMAVTATLTVSASALPGEPL
jgi:hypothetical protein